MTALSQGKSKPLQHMRRVPVLFKEATKSLHDTVDFLDTVVPPLFYLCTRVSKEKNANHKAKRHNFMLQFAAFISNCCHINNWTKPFHRRRRYSKFEISIIVLDHKEAIIHPRDMLYILKYSSWKQRHFSGKCHVVKPKVETGFL